MICVRPFMIIIDSVNQMISEISSKLAQVVYDTIYEVKNEA